MGHLLAGARRSNSLELRWPPTLTSPEYTPGAALWRLGEATAMPMMLCGLMQQPNGGSPSATTTQSNDNNTNSNNVGLPLWHYTRRPSHIGALLGGNGAATSAPPGMSPFLSAHTFTHKLNIDTTLGEYSPFTN